MQIQQLMNLTSGPDTGAQTAAPAKGDAAAFSRTLANALEGSGPMAEAARGVASELREAMAGSSDSDALSQALSRLQAQGGGDSASGNGPLGGLGDLMGQLRGRLEQLRAGLEPGSTAQQENLNDLISRMDQLQSRLEASGDTAMTAILERLGSVQSDGEAVNAADRLTERLAAVREQLEQVRAGLEAGNAAQQENVDDLISRMEALQARLESGDNPELAESPALGALLQRMNAGPQATGEAARTTQANVERNLAEQAQALRQVISENAGNTTARQVDARTDSVLSSAQEGARNGDGMSNAARETFSGSLAAVSGSMSSAPSNAGAAAATATGNLTAPVGTQAWDQQLSQQMIRFSQQGGEQRVNLQLHPPELGSISVKLTLNDQNAQAQFMSHNAQVRQALEQAIPQLRDALAEQGVSLGEASVGEQSMSEEGDARADGMVVSGATDGGDDSDGEAVTTITSRDIPLDGRVDVYA